MNYDQYSHTHCWNQRPPACGILLADHRQCCLCEAEPLVKPLFKETAKSGSMEERFDELIPKTADVLQDARTEKLCCSREAVRRFIFSELTLARAQEREAIYNLLPKKEFPGYQRTEENRIFSGGRNSAIDEMQEILRPSHVTTSTDGPEEETKVSPQSDETAHNASLTRGEKGE